MHSPGVEMLTIAATGEHDADHKEQAELIEQAKEMGRKMAEISVAS